MSMNMIVVRARAHNFYLPIQSACAHAIVRDPYAQTEVSPKPYPSFKSTVVESLRGRMRMKLLEVNFFCSKFQANFEGQTRTLYR